MIVSIRELANWSGTKKIGLLLTNSTQQAIHPSNDLRNENRSINKIISHENESIIEWESIKFPTLINWS